jgi:hypothetical protein
MLLFRLASSGRQKPKVKFFEWTAMHQKILMADNLAARGMQHNQNCPLCNGQAEDAKHLLTGCPFSLEVIRLIWAWFNLPGNPTPASSSQGTAAWLSSSVARAGAAQVRHTTVILLYCWWNIWKERNRCIFESLHRNEFQVASGTKQEIELYRLAFREE